nr:hypothetical protein GCM10020063_041260 [Dactylosporangium thailandense]
MSAAGVSAGSGAGGGVPGRHGCPGPRSAGGQYPQRLAQPADLGEPPGVVRGGHRAGSRPARRAGLRLTARARAPLDVIGVTGLGIVVLYTNHARNVRANISQNLAATLLRENGL